MICKLWYFNFFLCNLDSFYLFFFSLLCLGISILYWIKIVKQYPCLVPWRKYFQLFTVECDINIGLSYIAFLLLRYVPSLGNFVPQLCWEVFIVTEYCIWSKAFSASVHIIICFVFCGFLMWCVILIDLQILIHPYIPGKNLTWSHCMILLIYC